MAFDPKTLNAFDTLHRMAACEIPARRSGHRAFIGIYPPLPDKGIAQWRVRRFEIPNELVDKSIYDGDLLDLQHIHAGTIDEVEDILRSWSVASSMFDAPWKCAWPL
jgi:hypothetical protein